jgi:hypothetical protein
LFFGSFMPERLLQSEDVEVAWQSIPTLTQAADQEHFYRHTVEINIVIRGWIELNINDRRHRVEQGQFFVIWPEATVSSLSSSHDAELIVVRAPGLTGDKVLGKP